MANNVANNNVNPAIVVEVGEQNANNYGQYPTNIEIAEPQQKISEQQQQQTVPEDEKAQSAVPPASTTSGRKRKKGKDASSRKSSGEEKVFACKYCDKVFPSAQCLGGHMNAHYSQRKQDKVKGAIELLLSQGGPAAARLISASASKRRKPGVPYPAVPLFQNMFHGTGGIMPCTDNNNNNVSSTSSAAAAGVGHVQNYYNFPAMQFPSSSQAQMLFPNSTNVVTRAQPQAQMLLPNSPNVVLQAQPQAQAPPHNNIIPNMKLGQPPLQRHMVNKNMINMNVNMATGSNSVHPPAVTSSSPVGMVTSGYSLQNPNNNNSSLRTTNTNPCYRAPSSTAFMNCIHSHNNNHSPCPTCIQFQARLLKQPNFNPDLGVAKHPSEMMMMMKMKMENMNSNTSSGNTRASSQQQHYSTVMVPHSMHQKSNNHTNVIINTQSGSSSLQQIPMPMPVAAFLPSQCQSQSQGNAAVQEQSQSQSPWVNTKEDHTHTRQQQQQQAEDIINSYHEYSPSEHDSFENPALQILQPIAAFLPSQCQSKSQSQGSAAVQEQSQSQSQSQSPCVNAQEAHTHTSQQQQQEAEDIIKSYHEYSPSEHDSLENPAGIPARFDTDHGEEDWTALIDSFF